MFSLRPFTYWSEIGNQDYTVCEFDGLSDVTYWLKAFSTFLGKTIKGYFLEVDKRGLYRQACAHT